MSLRKCESICDEAIWDQGIDENDHPCYSFNSYHDREEDDHWNHWDDDDHGNDEQRNDPWNLLIEDEVCNA